MQAVRSRFWIYSLKVKPTEFTYELDRKREKEESRINQRFLA